MEMLASYVKNEGKKQRILKQQMKNPKYARKSK
jgi:hypothetical protein